MSVTLNGTNGITFTDGSSQNTAATGFGFKNRIINGAMMIDQRNAGASVSFVGGASTFSVDRWQASGAASSQTWTIQRNAGSVTPPAGFANYLGVTATNTASGASTDTSVIRQRIEGFNVADLGFGTANAQTITLSFWVRSSVTGNLGGAVVWGSVNANERSYPFLYAVNSANTWEQKTITIVGDTTSTSGGFDVTNGSGIQICFGIAVGSNAMGTAGAWTAGNLRSATGASYIAGTNGATWQITGVQLEKGSTATSFDYRPYGTELALCQRYYFGTYEVISLVGANTGGNYLYMTVNYPQPMRASPTITRTGNGIVTNSTAGTTFSNTTANYSMCYNTGVAVGGTFTASAEL